VIVALDVQYSSSTAFAAAVVFEAWDPDRPVTQYAERVSPVAAYEPGAFYLRELPPLCRVVEKLRESVDTLVIDGYCHLSPEGKPGLGAYLRDALKTPAAIVGVAKNRFRDSRHAEEVLRSGSARPLFVTSIGMESTEAADCIRRMAGPYRIPKLLKAADQLARSAAGC